MPSELRVDNINSTTSPYDPVFSTTGGALSHRNMMINGAMQVRQRGNGRSHASSSTLYSACDRFQLYHSNNGAATTNQAAGPTDKGFADSLHVDITTSDTGLTATDRADIIYSFEGQDLQHIRKGTSAAKAVILSFWVKSPKTGIHVVEFYDTDNTRHICKTYTVAAANTWENHSVSIPADTTGAFGNDNLKSLEIHWWLLAGSNYTSGTLQTTWGSPTTANRAVGQVNVYDNTSNNFYLTGVQLELGTVATPFEHKSFQEELLRCQRYFINYGINDAGGFSSSADTTYRSTTPSASNTIAQDTCFANVDLPVRLRTGNVTFTAGRAFNGSGSNLSNTAWGPFVAGAANAQRICIQKITNPMTTNQTVIVLSFSVSAEL